MRSICALAIMTVASTVASAQTAAGVVFEDSNADGMRQPGETGLPGVMISNGRDVVLTDDHGRYEIGLSNPTDTTISVIETPTHRARVDELNIPRFYYIHKPNGSPDQSFLYLGVPPTGPLPSSIDFAMEPRTAQSRFDVLLVGDPQPYTDQEVSWYGRDLISELRSVPAAFAMALGDLVGDDLDLFTPYNEMNALSGHVWRNVYGNHDMNFMSPNDEHADETFERVFGPTDYAFFHGEAFFIVLDNVRWNGFDGRNKNGKPKNGNYVGALSDRQLALVENLLRHVPQDALVVLATHIPLEGDDPRTTTENRDRLMRILSGHPGTLSVSGHTHLQRHFYFGSAEGYTPRNGAEHHHYNVVTASGTWWRGAQDERGIPHTMMRDGAPNGYAVLSIDGNRYSVRYKAAGHPDSYQMNIYAPDVASGGETFSVNVFNGSPKSRVEFTLGELGAWSGMELTPGIDPRYEEIVRSDVTEQRGRALNKPAVSHHIWSARLPEALGPGTQWLWVRATDPYGREDIASFPIRTVKDMTPVVRAAE